MIARSGNSSTTQHAERSSAKCGQPAISEVRRWPRKSARSRATRDRSPRHMRASAGAPPNLTSATPARLHLTSQPHPLGSVADPELPCTPRLLAKIIPPPTTHAQPRAACPRESLVVTARDHGLCTWCLEPTRVLWRKAADHAPRPAAGCKLARRRGNRLDRRRVRPPHRDAPLPARDGRANERRTSSRSAWRGRAHGAGGERRRGRRGDEKADSVPTTADPG